MITKGQPLSGRRTDTTYILNIPGASNWGNVWPHMFSWGCRFWSQNKVKLSPCFSRTIHHFQHWLYYWVQFSQLQPESVVTYSPLLQHSFHLVLWPTANTKESTWGQTFPQPPTPGVCKMYVVSLILLDRDWGFGFHVQSEFKNNWIFPSSLSPPADPVDNSTSSTATSLPATGIASLSKTSAATGTDAGWCWHMQF